MLKFGIDLYGGDNAPKIVLEAILNYLKKNNDIIFYLYGDIDKISKLTKENEFIKFIDAKEVLPMDIKDVSSLIRKNKEISLFKLMKDKDNYDAIISAGPTQAVVAGTHFLVGRLENIRRIALAPIFFNTKAKPKFILDAGANTTLLPEQLNELATIGSVYAKYLFNEKNPKVGLLNIGTEEGKGRECDVSTYNLLKENKNINFIGNIEPYQAISDDVSIVLQDGFAGNIFMKSMEAIFNEFKDYFKKIFKESLRVKLGALMLKRDLKILKDKISPKKVGGALLLGASKIVVKAHGSSDEVAYLNAIKLAKNLVEKDVINKVKELMSCE